MSVTAVQVKELREKTGVGMMDCKKVLTEAAGDFELAIKLLRERGLSAASKKADRSTNEGRIFTLLDTAKKKGVIVELGCETDFVGSNDAFIQMGNDIAKALLEQNITTQDALPTLQVNGKLYTDLLSENVLKLGENLSVKRVEVIATEGQLSAYTHMNGKIGVLINFSKSVEDELGRDIAMHAAATSPQYLNQTAVPASEVEAEREIIRTQIRQEGKPETMIEKIAEGKIGKFFKDICLVEQAFVKDQTQSIQQILPQGVEITHFVRYAQV
ncbi:MAG: elongation factor Ts [Candidatus Margulisbacteria bacterium]|nr:elongation factor Ts [Candidatus Margulisiibacteriota bacterium]